MELGIRGANANHDRLCANSESCSRIINAMELTKP
jgi:hypothetical protein